MKYYLGTSGWYYAHWAERFYPSDLPRGEWLQYYSKRFDTVEVNASFYRLPSESMVRGWREKTPEGFVFAFKGSRVVTHLKKLRGVEEFLQRFYGRIELVGEKLGVVLWQLPPSLGVDVGLLESFVAGLNREIPQVVEFRNASWFTEDVYRVLERFEVGLCVVSSPSMPVVVRVTAPVAYVRWHGASVLYGSRYSLAEMEAWAGVLAGLHARDVFGYFNNDACAYAPQNCVELREALGRRLAGA
jgi:uncharacterized protein YecE (DUF72 family)